MPARRKDTAAAFDLFWIPEPNSGCWLWLGGVDRRGYGMFWFDGKTGRATHFALRKFKGQEVPPDLKALHHCDNPGCVNPDHLYIGTTLDNSADAKRRKRHAHGIKHGCAILTDADIIDIRASKDGPRTIAKKYGMERSTIQKIRTRKLWKHVA